MIGAIRPTAGPGNQPDEPRTGKNSRNGERPGSQTSFLLRLLRVSDSFPAPSISEYWVLRSFDSRLAGPSLVRTQLAVRRNHCSITLSRRTSTVREGRGLRPGRAPPAMARRRAMLCTALVAGVGGAAGFTIPLHQLRVKVGREARTGSRSLALTARVSCRSGAPR